jgi:hypothetical protein
VTKNKYEALWIASLWVLGLAFSAWSFQSLGLHYDHLQILKKAILFYETGELSHFGNYGSGVGFVPGSVTTVLSAVPMKIYFSPYSAMAVIALFHVLAAIALIWMGKKLAPDGSLTVLILLLFWLNPWRVEQSELYNPGYLPLFSGLHIWSAFKLRDKKHWAWSALHVIAIGLCAQIHYSAVILAVTSLLLWWSGRVRVNWGGIALGVGLVVLTLVPYFSSVTSEPNLEISLQHSEKAFLGRNLVLVYPVFKAILYWFRYGSTYFGRHVFSEIRFDFISDMQVRQVAEFLLRIMQWPIALFTLFISFRWVGSVLRSRLNRSLFKPGPTGTSVQTWWFDYVAMLFIGMVVAACLSPVEFNHWHLILCLPAVTLTMAWFLRQWLNSQPQRRRHAVLGAIFLWFVAQNSFLALGSRSHSWRNDFGADFQKYYLEQGSKP